MTEGGQDNLGAVVQQVEAATACVQAASTPAAVRAEAAGFCERVRDTCGAEQLCALAAALCASTARTTASLHYALQLLECASAAPALAPPQRAELARFLAHIVADAPPDGLLSACLRHSPEQCHAVAGKAAAVLAAALARADPGTAAQCVCAQLVPQLRVPRTVAVAAAARALGALIDVAEGADPGTHASALAPAQRRALGAELRAALRARAPTPLCAALADALAWLCPRAAASAAATEAEAGVPRRVVLSAVRSVLELAAAHVRTASRRVLRACALTDALAAMLDAAPAALPWDVAGAACDVLLAWTQRALPVQYSAHAPALIVLFGSVRDGAGGVDAQQQQQVEEQRTDRVLAAVLSITQRAAAACAPTAAATTTMDSSQQAAFAVLVKGAEVLAATAAAALAYGTEYPRYAPRDARVAAVGAGLVALARHPAPEVALLVHGAFAALCRARTVPGAPAIAAALLPDRAVAELCDAALARFRARNAAAFYCRDAAAATDAAASTRDFLAALTRLRPALFFEQSLRRLVSYLSQLSAADGAASSAAAATEARLTLGIGNSEEDSTSVEPESLTTNPCLVFLDTSVRSLRDEGSDNNSNTATALGPETRALLEQFVALVLQYAPRPHELRLHAHVLAALGPLLPRALPHAADSAFRKAVEYYTRVGTAGPLGTPLFEDTRYEVLRLLKTLAACLVLGDATVEQFVAWYQSANIGPHDRHHFIPVLVSVTFVPVFAFVCTLPCVVSPLCVHPENGCRDSTQL